MATKKAASNKPALKKKAGEIATRVKELSAREKLEAFGIEKICDKTADCTPMRKIAAEIGVHWLTMTRWIDDDSDKSAQYARAREAQADKLVEDIVQIADDGANDTYETDNGTATNQDVIARSRLRVDARKWLASKMAPKKYGEKVTQEHTGADGGPIDHSITVSFVEPK